MKKKKIIAIGIVLVLCLLSFLFALLSGRGPKEINLSGLTLEKAEVIKIIDGDTIDVRDSKGKEIRIRYIGIDAPETDTLEGMLAKEKNIKIIEDAGYLVWISFGKEPVDKYGRNLCYIFLKDGEDYVMVEDLLLSEGLARVMTIEPNDDFSRHYEEIEAVAKKNKIGIWKEK